MIGNQLEIAPIIFRFPTTNQMRHCFIRYVEYHRLVTQLYTSHSSFVFLSVCYVFLSNKGVTLMKGIL
ncbi:Cytochrome c oxidase subunit 6b-2 [Capsicum annuum]|uniref:Cytochrome c oxidase subunit 6b-2 n=1 Tax=Capsicum annuum TaxID=4072 RepID=A0A2G2ZMN1_CAPAN|nr:Cytochrome c oxidase subunit 6b-2 [Capsicum annuum]KAF3622677.1 Cytochrome c oxidase subunit 6b-2 [Capsicum annuum]PHT83164.1 Cytochrome c oxidase subunit 6b-2 [Capsicum annuum]